MTCHPARPDFPGALLEVQASLFVIGEFFREGEALLMHPAVERASLWGMVTSLLGDFAGAVFFGIMLFVYPGLAPFVEGSPRWNGK